MTSTTSFKEKLRQSASMFAWDLKACSGSLTVYAILAGVFTVIALTLCLVSDSLFGAMTGVVSVSTETTPLSEKIESFQIAATNIVYLLTIIFTVIYTIQVYSYMHNKRKADFYCSLPISRQMLYLTKTCSAYLFSIVPALFFMGIISLISICTGTLMVTEAVSMYLQLIIGTLACVSAYGLIAACCGTTMNSVVMILAVCIAYPVAAGFIKGTVSGFFYGVYTGSLNGSFIMNALNPIAAYNGQNALYWIIFSIVCIVGGTILTRKRKSERAQTSFAYYLPCYIVKLLVSFIAGMFLGTIFASLEVFGEGMLGFVFGFILASAAAYVIAHLIFYKGFTKLIKSSIPYGALAVIVIAGVALCNADIMGYNSFVPSAENVKSAGFIASDYYYQKDGRSIYKDSLESSEDFTDEDTIGDIIRVHEAIIDTDDLTSSVKFRRIWIDMLDNVLNGGLSATDTSYTIAYKLDNGSVVTRYYSKIYDESVVNFSYAYDSSFYDIKLTAARNRIISQKPYVMKYSGVVNAKANEFDCIDFYAPGTNENGTKGEIYIYADDDFGAGYTYIMYDENNTTDNQILMKKIADALVKDIEEDENFTNVANFDDYDPASSYWSEYGSLSEDTACRISFDITNYSLGDTFFEDRLYTSGYYLYETYNIPKSYKNTLNVLVSEGLLNSDYTINTKHPDYQWYYE